jgi:nitroimidazol reductase NimA-like FMN-containing flavoprotein (pyridoxamine 5'-phosphate oxidase superfamily)
MNVPVTVLDQRYSSPDAQAVSWEDTQRLLEAAEIFWISTVRADGRPHVTPVVAVWTDGALYFATGSGEQKFLNLRANPHVVLTTGANDWTQGIDVMVEGKAVQVTDEAELARVAEAFRAKWNGAWQYEVRDGRLHHSGQGGSAEVFGVTPTRAFSHSKGEPFGATTHRF